jgi:hypothetical protein
LWVNESAEWFELAACRAVYQSEHVDYWHAPEPGDKDFVGTGQMPASRLRRAKQVCNDCPVRTECLTYALEREEKEGIWAGLWPHERRDLWKKWAALPPAEQAEMIRDITRQPLRLAQLHKRGKAAS